MKFIKLETISMQDFVTHEDNRYVIIMSELEGKKIIDVYRNKLHISTVDSITTSTHAYGIQEKGIEDFNLDFKQIWLVPLSEIKENPEVLGAPSVMY
jgi:hypothetical protein